ncbi:tripartite tricarboxylate transporter substrate binding protein [Hydrogenophaga sp. 2FB]|uniref:Bug family tripartite tricarboxylate transporter substrate binding protein n=1 Tax=Hydrogenophaga sp. 2FB TaxID=2502187 RepID=UPI0010F57853|nr:tripartite tricarboxylate transporter substrate binding protein [Hydrogenophaga sp. 2FB]
MKSRAFLLSLLSLAALGSLPAQAQSNFPNRPVKLVIPFPAGGSTDIIGRALAQQLSDLWGKQMVVDNRPGAGGSIGADFVAKAPADGYTLLLGHTGTMSVNPLIYPNLPYDPAKSFAPVSLVTLLPLVFAANATIPPKTVSEVISYAQANPGKMNYGSAGNGSANHLAMEYFKLLTKTNIVHVPYKGTAPAVTDLLSNQVSLVMVGAATVLPHIQSGRVKVLAVASPKRLEVLPDAPTMSEAGLNNFDPSPWFGILAPAGTPPELVAKINADIVKVMGTEQSRKALASEGAVIMTNTPQQFADLIKADLQRWSKVVKDTGMKIE